MRAAIVDGWQQATIEHAKVLLESDAGVLGLVLIGSLTRTDVAADVWSDVDLVIVVDEQSLVRFFPATGWIEPLGELYCIDQSDGEFFGVTRAQFADGRRIDSVIVTEPALGRIREWEHNPLRFMNQCLFSRSSALDRVLGMSFPPPVLRLVSPEQFERMCNDFRFKGMLAVSKIARNELLVALHLSLDMVRDCLVLGMMLRDRETGTDHHRDGSLGNHYVDALSACQQQYTAEGILDSIEQSAIAFDRLAGEWDNRCRERRGPLLDQIGRAREYHRESCRAHER